MTTLVFALFGLIVGSFLNVLILRRGKERLSGRSKCPYCGKKISWYDNIPVLSWLLLGGRCRHCGGNISLQYPAVEILTAIIFALIGGASVDILSRLVALPIAALLIAIAVHDLKTTIIPDPWVYTFAAMTFLAQLASSFIFPAQSLRDLFLALAAGPIATFPLGVLFLISHGRWMGLGDVKLALGIGWLLGPIFGFVAVMFAFMIGALVSVLILLPLPAIAGVLQRWGIAHSLSRRSYTMKSEIPFGPFLIASCLFIWLSQLYGIQLPIVSIYGM